MPIQSHAPVTVGTAGVKNVMGAWHLLIPEVEADSIWCLVQASIVSDAFDTITLELGVGLTGEEVRRWKSFTMVSGGGGTLEYDDSWWVKYNPFRFRKGERISARTAGPNQGSGVNADIQLQLYS